MKLPSVKNLSVTQKRVLLRTDYDVPLKLAQSAKCKVQSWRVTDATRIADSLPTINYLLSKQAKIIILSHLGRPEGRVVEELSLEPVANMLAVILKCQIVKQEDGWKIGEEIFLKENLRFNPEEEGNDPKFAQNLGSLGDFYVNDAFACSHRKHASIVGIPKFLPASRRAFGFDFLEEVKALTKIKDNPRRPVVVILGGVKEDKLKVMDELTRWADYILIGGKLPTLMENGECPPARLRQAKQAGRMENKGRIVVASLNPEGKDITLETIEKFTEIIKNAGTIVWAGPMGIFEDKRFEKGTKEIAEAIVKSGAFSVVGGGDTEAALTKFALDKKVSFISSGGGAMLEFLAKGTLPGIEAIKNG